MSNKIYLMLLFFAGMASAQQLTFTDPALKTNLLLSDVNNAIALNFADQQMKIDANNNGQIEQSEANLVKKLFITEDTVTSIGGIEGFTNLEILWIYDPAITEISLVMPALKELDVRNTAALASIDATGLPALEKVYCTFNNNALVSMDFSGCTALNDLYAPSNPVLANVNFSGCSALATVNLTSCAIADLNLSGCSALTSLICSNNQLTELDLSDCVVLENLQVLSNPQMTNLIFNAPTTLATAWFFTDQPSLDLSNYTALSDLQVRGTLPVDVDLHNCTALTSIDFQSNVKSIDLSGCTALLQVSLSAPILESINLTNTPQLLTVSLNSSETQNTVLTTLDVSNHPNLTYILVYNIGLDSLITDNCPLVNELRLFKTTLPSVDVSGFPLLGQLYLSENPNITELDLSTLTGPNTFVWVSTNPQLTYINLKNGVSENFNLVSNSGNTIFICQDEAFIAQTLANIDPEQSTDLVNCNSYCSFVPGGDYNTITGTILFDADNNGCGLGDIPRPDIKVNINDSTVTGSSFTLYDGSYNFYTSAGSFDLTPAIENPSYFAITPVTATVPFADDNNNVTTQNFCMTAVGNHPDLEIAIAPIVPARPGFAAVYQVAIKNIGNQTLSGSFTFTFQEDVLDFVSATLPPTIQASGLLSWSYNNLAPFENRSVDVVMNVNAPTMIPPVNIGDELNFTVTVNPIVGDENPSNNQMGYKQTVVGSFDPNDITCIEGDVVAPSEIGSYLHYVANFENLGTAAAENVVVRLEIDTDKFDVNSLQLLHTSHPNYTRITGNIVEYIFEGINLAPAQGDPPVGGHGNVLFKIKTNAQLAQGDFVEKLAKIYFDYNFPVETNLAHTVFNSLSTPGYADLSISIVPNPTKDFISIESDFNILTVSLYDIQGRLLETDLIRANAATFDLSAKSNGVYFVKVTSDRGIKVEKIIKE